MPLGGVFEYQNVLYFINRDKYNNNEKKKKKWNNANPGLTKLDWDQRTLLGVSWCFFENKVSSNWKSKNKPGI